MLICNTWNSSLKLFLMQRLICNSILALSATASVWSGEVKNDETVLSAAVRLRTESIAPIVIDPAVLDMKLLRTRIAVDATTQSSAVSQLKKALEPIGLIVVDQGGEVWITRRNLEADLSRQIALVVNATDYRRLASALRLEEKRNAEPNIRALAEMAEFMALQSELPAKASKFVDEKSKKIKSLQFMQKNALSGSALSPPDPARAGALELDIEKLRDEVRAYFGQIADRFVASNFDPSDPSSAPPPIFAVVQILPEVVYNRIAFNSQLFFAEAMEVLLRASTSLAFHGEKDKELASTLRARIDAINKLQIANKALLAEYIQLLERAGLLSGASASSATAGSAIGVDAANRLFNDFGDQRESVRLAIGKNIMGQLEDIARDIRAGRTSLLSASDTSELYLYGQKELDSAKRELGESSSFTPYSPDRYRRVGAVTGLTVRGGAIGETSTFSIELERRPAGGAASERSLQNIFGSKDELVEINTTAELAQVDGLFLGKNGAYAGQPSEDDPEAVQAWLDRLLGGSGMIASVSEALNLIKNQYDPSIFKSKVILGFDSNFQISYGGDSAGVAIALATLSRVRAKAIDSRLMVSGAVRQFGDVRPVGGVYLKGKAALEGGALVLLMPVSVVGHIMNLPAEKLLGRHVITLRRFKDAAGVACLDLAEANREPLEAVCLYNFALSAMRAGKFSDALSLCLKAVDVYPDHLSAQILKSLLLAAEVDTSDSSVSERLSEQAKAFANLLITNPLVGRDGSRDDMPVGGSSLMATIIPEFTLSNASGEEAFEILSDKARSAYGEPANITLRTRNEFFAEPFINLSMQGKTFEEILKELCSLCDAKFKATESSIIVDSTRPPARQTRPAVEPGPDGASHAVEETTKLKTALDGASKSQVREYFGGRAPDGVNGEDMWAYAGKWSDPESGVVFKKAVFSFYENRVRHIIFDK